uniref:Calmodulin-binding domain-containing protein n=1 Tax=Rhizophora mucronata TaxID=61149 RepID=A0A2P2IX39_RHIMU
MLNPGGTEAEGTSVIKVCPYTYCSLNGHQHTRLPPLKYFLRARQHSLKTQRRMKLEVSSPRKATNMYDAGMAKIDPGMPIDSFDFPTMQEIGMDFFVEIYANDKVDEAEATQKGTEEEDREAADEENKNQLFGGLYDASPQLKIDSKEHLEQYPDTGVANMKFTEFLLQEQEARNADPEHSPSLLQDEAATGCFDSRTDIGMECQTSAEEDDSISEVSGMEWKEGQFFAASEVDAEVGQFDTSDENFDAKIEYLSDIKKLDLVFQPEIIKEGEFVSNFPDEIPTDEMLQELFEEETASFASKCNNSVSELDAKQQKGKILESSYMNGSLTSDPPSSAAAAFEELPDMEEKNKEAEADLIDTWPSSSQFGDGENNLTTDMTTENLIHFQEGRYLQGDDVTTWIQNKASEGYNKGQKSGDTNILAGSVPSLDQKDRTEDREQGENVKTLTEIQLLGSSLGFPDIIQDDAEVNDNKNCIIAETCLLNGAADDIALNKDLLDGSDPTEPQSHKFDGHFMSTDAIEELNLLEQDQDAANRFNIPDLMDSDEKADPRAHEVKKAEEDGRGNNAGDAKKMEEEGCNQSDPAENFLTGDNGTSRVSQCTSLHTGSTFDQEIPNTCNTRKLKFSIKKSINDSYEGGVFNPREPNFLDVAPDLEAEKVDLRHQTMDYSKNAEEWMLDFALQQAVTKLAPVKKRKVALLVQAFETVLPTPKHESQIRHTSATFSHARPIQACS